MHIGRSSLTYQWGLAPTLRRNAVPPRWSMMRRRREEERGDHDSLPSLQCGVALGNAVAKGATRVTFSRLRCCHSQDPAGQDTGKQERECTLSACCRFLAYVYSNVCQRRYFVLNLLNLLLRSCANKSAQASSRNISFHVILGLFHGTTPACGKAKTSERSP